MYSINWHEMCCDMWMIDEQIRVLSEQGGGVEEIAAALKCEPAAVQYSLARAGKVSLEDKDIISELEGIVVEIARNPEENTRFRLDAAKFAIEVGKGIKTNKNALPFIPAVQINQLILNASRNIQQFVSGRNGGAISEAQGNPESSGQSADGAAIESSSQSPNPPPSPASEPTTQLEFNIT